MRSNFATALMALTLLFPSAYGAIIVDIAKTTIPEMPRQLSKRYNIHKPILNNISCYTAMTYVGTPRQKMSFVIDTGSTDVWMIASEAPFCTKPWYKQVYHDVCHTPFDYKKSSSYQLLGQSFYIGYADGSKASGDYISDTLNLAGTAPSSSIQNLTMGLVYEVRKGFGVMGLGYGKNLAGKKTFPTVMNQMVNQGIIEKEAYSIFLNSLHSRTGAIIFGGIDKAKFTGELVELPIVPSRIDSDGPHYTEIRVEMSGVCLADEDGSITNITEPGFKTNTLLDTGSTVSYLPEGVTEPLYQKIGALDAVKEYRNVFVNCNIRDDDMSFNFEFDGVEIKVPVGEMVSELLPGLGMARHTPGLARKLPFGYDTCNFGVYPSKMPKDKREHMTLGDNFLRSAYVVVDMADHKLGLAQANWSSRKSKVVDIKRDVSWAGTKGVKL